VKRVLFVAYYTPPLGLSGVMRVTKLTRFLPEFGWEVLLLTVKDVAYYAYAPDLVADLSKAKVFRTASLDPNGC
jgi:spore coat polysaccharide biosynthesis predicted glycosyltransferase SpsG